MDMFLEPFIQSSLADQVLRYHFGFEHPDRKRSQLLRGRNVVLSKRRRRGSGTESILASVALPLLVAAADRQESLVRKMLKSLVRLEVGRVFDRDPDTATVKSRVDVSKRFTTAFEKLARNDPTLSMDKGRVVRVDGPWSLVAVGDPRTDSYRLERVPSAGLSVSGLASERQLFVRVLMHEEGRLPRAVYLPAWQADSGPSPAVFEMLLRATSARPIPDSSKCFAPKKKTG